jgi:hypothetical protein
MDVIAVRSHGRQAAQVTGANGNYHCGLWLAELINLVIILNYLGILGG